MDKLYFENMTKLERYIANLIDGNQGDFTDMSITTFSKQANVSAAMLSKYSKNCGFTGYKELRYYVKAYLAEDSENYEQVIDCKIDEFFSNYNSKQLKIIRKYCKLSSQIILIGTNHLHCVCTRFANRVEDNFNKQVIVGDIEQLPSSISAENSLILILVTSENFQHAIDEINDIKAADSKVIIISQQKMKLYARECNLYISLLTDSSADIDNEHQFIFLFQLYFEMLIHNV